MTALVVITVYMAVLMAGVSSDVIDEKCFDNYGYPCVGCLGQDNICSDLPFNRCKQLGLIWCSEQYDATSGYCRGGVAWSSGQLWDCSPGSKTDADCATACDARSECAAYDRAPGSGVGECCLYTTGNTGDEQSNRVCMVKKVVNEAVGKTDDIVILHNDRAFQCKKTHTGGCINHRKINISLKRNVDSVSRCFEECAQDQTCAGISYGKTNTPVDRFCVLWSGECQKDKNQKWDYYSRRDCIEVDPCVAFPCGTNANCDPSKGSQKCSCPQGMTGNPRVICVSQRGCELDNECGRSDKCYRGICRDACRMARCGSNAVCEPGIHTAKCICLPGYAGNPHTSCKSIHTFPSGKATPAPAQIACKGFRASANCRANGPREPAFDKECSHTIHDNTAGYCQCSHGRVNKHCWDDSWSFWRNCDQACEGAVLDTHPHVASGYTIEMDRRNHTDCFLGCAAYRRRNKCEYDWSNCNPGIKGKKIKDFCRASCVYGSIGSSYSKCEDLDSVRIIRDKNADGNYQSSYVAIKDKRGHGCSRYKTHRFDIITTKQKIIKQDTCGRFDAKFQYEGEDFAIFEAEKMCCACGGGK